MKILVVYIYFDSYILIFLILVVKINVVFFQKKNKKNKVVSFSLDNLVS